MRSRWRQSVPYAAASAVALVAALIPVTPGHADLPGLSFYVVSPDGLPVVRPYVMSWVLGGAQTIVHQSRGSAEGQVTVTVPDDVMAAERIAAGRPVNIMSLVMDREPGTPGLAAVPVASAINASGIPTLSVDVGGTGGQVYTLIEGLVEFTPAPVGEEQPDEPDCPYATGAAVPEPCTLIDWPEEARETMVPVAENYGAGKDVVASMTYQSTTRTTTSVAFSGGKSGFVEARGGVSYIKDTSTGFGWAPVGPDFNKRVLLQTTFQRTRSGACWHDMEPGGERHCALTTTYHPFEAVGTGSTPQPGWSDTLDVVLDCKNKLDGYYDKGKGTSTGQFFSLALGSSETWADTFISQTRGLHAQSTVTAETTSGKGFQRKWEVIPSPQYGNHWMMVKGGNTIYNATEKGGGAGACPDTAVQDAYTHATNQDLLNPEATAQKTADDAEEEARYRLCDPPGTTDRLEIKTPDSVGPEPAPTSVTVNPRELLADLSATVPVPEPSPVSGTSDETDPCG